MDDYYSVLRVPPTANTATISAAYRRIALRYHPDRHPGNPGATKIFERATEAFEVLGNSERRLRYDERYSRRSSSLPRKRSTSLRRASNSPPPLRQPLWPPPLSPHNPGSARALHSALTIEWPSLGQMPRHVSTVPWHLVVQDDLCCC